MTPKQIRAQELSVAHEVVPGHFAERKTGKNMLPHDCPWWFSVTLIS
jgi:hypothetical protein